MPNFWQYQSLFRPPPEAVEVPKGWMQPTNLPPEDAEYPVDEGGNFYRAEPSFIVLDFDWLRSTNQPPEDVEYIREGGTFAPLEPSLHVTQNLDWLRPVDEPVEEEVQGIQKSTLDVPWHVILTPSVPDLVYTLGTTPSFEDDWEEGRVGPFILEPSLFIEQNLDWLRPTNEPTPDVEPSPEGLQGLRIDTLGNPVPDIGWLPPIEMPPADVVQHPSPDFFYPKLLIVPSAQTMQSWIWTMPPTATNDSSEGYLAGRDVWINRVTGQSWILTDDTVGAAVWTLISFRAIHGIG